MKHKRILSIIPLLTAAAVFFVSLPILADDEPVAPGSGTAEDPYIITNAQQLELIGDLPEANYRLAADIEVTDKWTGQSFSGVLDGDGYKVTIANADNGFINTNRGTVKNLSLDITDESTFPALLTYYNYGTIENVHISGAMASSRASYLGCAALINREGGVIKNSYATASVSYQGEIKPGNGTQCYGLLVGLNEGEMTNCYWLGSYSYQVESLYGENEGTVTGCHQGGEYGKSDEAMRLPDTYSGWDFDAVWKFDPDFNDGFPVLQNEREFIKIPVSGILLDPTAVRLEVGDTAALLAQALPDTAWNKNISWYSSDEAVASVSSEGVVTANALGKAEITAVTEDGGYKASCAVSVEVFAESVTLDRAEAVLVRGESLTLTAAVSPADATDKSVLWQSDNAGVAAVSEGTVTAVSPGTAVITAVTNDGGYADSCVVRVIRPENERYDMNGDGSCTLEDAALLAQYLAGHTDTGVLPGYADTNGDGRANSRDVTAVLTYIERGGQQT